MMRIGLIGFGAIGRSIAELWDRLPPHAYRLAAVCVRHHQHDQARAVLAQDIPVCSDVEQLLDTGVDCIIEAAGHGVVQSHGSQILKRGCSMYMLSVGSLAAVTLRESL